MIISAHQTNFLPYSGFWFKLATSDVMDLRYRAQFTERGYQRRVKMRDKWCSLPLVDNPRLEPINKVRIDLPRAKTEVRNVINGRYSGAKHFKTRGIELLDAIDAIETGYLWEFNLELLLHVRDVLGIDTPFALGVDTIGDKAEGVVSLLRAWPQADTYLSGTGARAYMGDTALFDEAGIKVQWSEHRAITHDSIVTLLMDYDDPMEIVMLTNTNDEKEIR